MIYGLKQMAPLARMKDNGDIARLLLGVLQSRHKHLRYFSYLQIFSTKIFVKRINNRKTERAMAETGVKNPDIYPLPPYLCLCKIRKQITRSSLAWKKFSCSNRLKIKYLSGLITISGYIRSPDKVPLLRVFCWHWNSALNQEKVCCSVPERILQLFTLSIKEN